MSRPVSGIDSGGCYVWQKCQMSDSEKMEGGHVMKEPEFTISKIKYYKRRGK